MAIRFSFFFTIFFLTQFCGRVWDATLSKKNLYSTVIRQIAYSLLKKGLTILKVAHGRKHKENEDGI